ncbi:hypothetical protein QTP70_032636 [Hemibagrus guttatus]|uniref:WD repeat-containing protein 92 n=1 Tax=Hemibagrus guttatus TaxID=175788 RepID=A0AAE0RHX3_9TELE|nr:hypothetical protein QTP70_032636 [Hemibagrus guttatus]KAK3573657.1 hypothetical protein QTP86_029961 [Hemibagrus guttatus]
MLEHGVCYGQAVTSTEVQQQDTTRVQIRWAVPPNHAPPGIIVVAHMGVEVPQQNYGVPSRSTFQHPSQGLQEGWVLHTAIRPISRNNSETLIPGPKAQGNNPLVYQGKLQHMAAELGGYKQAHPSPTPLTMGHSREEESPTSLKELGHAFNDQDRCVCAGYDNGDIKLFDLRNMSLRWEKNIKNGVCSVEFDRKDISMNKLVATSLEGKFHVFDMRTQHPTKGFASVSEKAHKSTIWQVRHLPQNRDIFMTTGGAGNLHLWKYEYPEKRSENDGNGVERGVAGTLNLLQNVTLSTQPIASLDWSPDKQGLCVCASFDQSVRVLIVTKLNRV